MAHGVKTLSRRELFDLVWATPITKLANDFGMSDRGFARLCARHKVPTPPRGYWSKIHAGRKKTIPPFLELRDRSLDEVRIRSVLHSLPAEVAKLTATNKAKHRQEEPREKVVGPVEFGRVQKPHSAVVPVIRTLRKTGPDTDGRVAAMATAKRGVSVHADSLERAISILDGIARALEGRALQVEIGDEDLLVVLGDDKIRFSLTEKTRRVKHVPTRAERAEEERRVARRSRSRDGLGFAFGRAWPEYETLFTGELTFKADVWADGLRKSWSDGKKQRLENLIPDIVAGLELLLVHEKKRRAEWEDRERVAEKMRLRRHLAKLRAGREEARVLLIRELFELRREADELRIWLGNLPEEARAVTNSDLGRMILWVEQRIAALEARTAIGAADAMLNGKSLFPEVDDLEDPEGDPPTSGYFSYY